MAFGYKAPSSLSRTDVDVRYGPSGKQWK
jgi:hypothetical protein